MTSGSTTVSIGSLAQAQRPWHMQSSCNRPLIHRSLLAELSVPPDLRRGDSRKPAAIRSDVKVAMDGDGGMRCKHRRPRGVSPKRTRVRKGALRRRDRKRSATDQTEGFRGRTSAQDRGVTSGGAAVAAERWPSRGQLQVADAARHPHAGVVQ